VFHATRSFSGYHTHCSIRPEHPVIAQAVFAPPLRTDGESVKSPESSERLRSASESPSFRDSPLSCAKCPRVRGIAAIQGDRRRASSKRIRRFSLAFSGSGNSTVPFAPLPHRRNRSLKHRLSAEGDREFKSASQVCIFRPTQLDAPQRVVVNSPRSRKSERPGDLNPSSPCTAP